MRVKMRRKTVGGRHDSRPHRAKGAGAQKARGQQSVAARHAAPLPVVVGRPVGGHTVHQELGGAEGDAEAFPGQRVDVTRGVTDQQHPPGGSAAHLLTQRARGTVLSVVVTDSRSFRAGKASMCSSNRPLRAVRIATPTQSSATGVTYASASADQYTSTQSVHGVIK